MRIAVIGSRDFNDYDQLKMVLNEHDNIELLVSGGAKGADSLGESWAKEKNVPTLIFKPEWDKYGRSAGFKRNQDIVNNSDLVIAFWDGQSRGTKSSIDLCKKLAVDVKIIKYK